MRAAARSGDEVRAAAARAELEADLQELRGRSDEIYRLGYELGYKRPVEAETKGEARRERIAWLALALEAAELNGSPARMTFIGQQRLSLLGLQGELLAAHSQAEELIGELSASLSSLPYLLTTKAGFERELGDYEAALDSLDEAERLFDPSDDRQARLRAGIPGLRGQIWLNLGMPDRAAPELSAELQAAEELYARDPSFYAKELVEAHLGSAELVMALADDETKVTTIRSFLDRRDLYEDHQPEHGLLLSLLGQALLESGTADAEGMAAGIATLEQALESRLAVTTRGNTWMRLAEAHLYAADIPAARTALEQAYAHEGPRSATGLRGPELHRAARFIELESRIALAGGAERAELEALRARAGEALDLLIEDWQRAPEREGGVGFLFYATRRAILGEWTNLSVALEGAERGAELALEQLIRVQAMGSLTRTLTADAPTIDTTALDEILADEKHGLLVYLPSRGASSLFVIDARGASHVSLATTAEILTARKRYAAHLSAYARGVPESRRESIIRVERELAGELSRLLLPAELLPRIAGWERLTIVGSDTLGYVPFAWLPIGPLPYLGAAMALDELPSLPVGVALARATDDRRQATESGGLVLVAAPLLDPLVTSRNALAELMLSEAEASSLTDPYATTQVLRAADAHLGAAGEALRRLGDGPKVLQLFVHGVRREDDPLRTRLALAAPPGAPPRSGAELRQPGLIGFEELSSLAPAADLVMLTACRSAAAPLRPGDPNASDLAGACLAAGSRSVLTARREIWSAEVLDASQVFHASLAAGRSPAEALTDVRADLVLERGELAPFYDGLYTVVGLGQAPLFPLSASARAEQAPGEPSRARLVVALLAVVGLIAFAIRLRVRASKP